MEIKKLAAEHYEASCQESKEAGYSFHKVESHASSLEHTEVHDTHTETTEVHHAHNKRAPEPTRLKINRKLLNTRSRHVQNSRNLDTASQVSKLKRSH
jgi:hypothetical protein